MLLYTLLAGLLFGLYFSLMGLGLKFSCSASCASLIWRMVIF